METAPPKKRARTAAADKDAEVPSKDDEFWYDDGTILLIAGNIEFRVYRGPLIKHSPFFRDMLSLPQPQEPRPSCTEPGLVQECPVVHLTDSPQDLRHLLRVFTAGDSPEPFGASAPSFHALSACIRLGHKYQIHRIFENRLQYLREFYFKHEPLPGTVVKPRSIIAENRPASVTGKSAIAIVNIARLTENYDLLPLALLECCKLGADIVEGYTHEDGSVEHLTAADLGRCFKAKDKLVLRNVEAYLKSIQSDGLPDVMCEGGERCQMSIKRLRPSLFHLRSVQVDGILPEPTQSWYALPSLCRFCRFVIESTIRKERRDFWNELPDLFDVAVSDGWQIED